jgi:CBS domain containing-hemolysin-like protein
MVPRVEMQGIPVEMTKGELVSLVRGQPHTRIPVYHGSMDDVVGVIHLKDLVPFVASLEAHLPEEHVVHLMPVVREAARVPETITIDKMLVEFKSRRQQMAIVIDEYGGTSGLITMGDLLQQVFGDVRDEFDEQQPEVRTSADGRVFLPGRTLIDEVNDRFSIGFRDDEADTVAGLILGELGRPAVVGDEVEIYDVLLRVEAIDRLRITEVSLLLPPNLSDGEPKNDIERSRDANGDTVAAV